MRFSIGTLMKKIISVVAAKHDFDSQYESNLLAVSVIFQKSRP